jgi:hypothetical protein
MQSAKKEWESTNKEVYTDLEWKENLKVLSQNHVYHTDYAIENWQFLKEKNIKVIEQEILNMENDFNNPLEVTKIKKENKKRKLRTKTRAWS